MINRYLINLIKKTFRLLWSILKFILWSVLVIVGIVLFQPLSERELAGAARCDFESVLYGLNRIDPALFKSDPIIKYKDGKKWYEWVYRSGSDSLVIGVTVSWCYWGILSHPMLIF